jgi:hypothetical protein
MQPAQLTPEHFLTYPPLAREVAVRNLDILRQLPLGFVPLLLGEVIAYDSKFPAERQEVDAQFAFMNGLPVQRRSDVMAQFARLRLSPALEEVDWVRNPGEFSERLSAHLWTTGQVADFRTAAVEFLERVRAAVPPPPPIIPRLSVVILGQGVTSNSYPLFRKLRPHGTYFTRVNPTDGLRTVIQRAGARAAQHPIRFGHWYVDGGSADAAPAGVETLAYGQLDPIRDAVVARLRSLLQAGAGTEARRSALMQLRPEDVGLVADGPDRVLNHFKVAVLSEGSGVQFFSTTFVQWAAREILRRAQPVTLVARFAPRVTEQSMNAALMGGPRTLQALDAEGALVDADMGAYYTWLNQMRLQGADRSAFIVWFENHSEALMVSPFSRPGVQLDEPLDLKQLLDRALG